MTAVTYTAKRKLISGHTAGTAYSLNLSLSQCDPMADPKGNLQVTMNGEAWGQLDYIEESYKCRLNLLNSSTEWPAVQEFLFSCMGFEVFSFDRTGSVAVPVQPVNCILVGKPSMSERAGYVTVSFEVRVLP